MKTEKDTPKIEDVTDDEIRNIIQTAMDTKMPEIRLMPYLGEEQEVTYDYPELVACCPMTGILDLYRVNIKYTPNNHIPELKSLKFYFLGYKNMRIGHEHLCSKITTDFREAVHPKSLEVNLDVAVRGGIKTDIKNESK